MPQYILQPAKTSVSARSSPLNTVDVSRGERPQRRRARINGCFRRLCILLHRQINAPVYLSDTGNRYRSLTVTMGFRSAKSE